MRKKIFVLFVVCAGLITIISSCENELPFRQGQFNPTLTLSGFIHIDSLRNSLILSFTGKDGSTPADGVTVQVRVNGELKETLRSAPDASAVYRTVQIATRFKPGDVVRIDAATDDGEHQVWVEETVPIPVQIDRIDTIDITNPNIPAETSYRKMRVNVSFKDRPAEKNYYRVMIENRTYLRDEYPTGDDEVEVNINHTFWPWDDIALTDGNPASSEELDNDLFERVTNLYGVFGDSWFKDSEYTLNLQVDIAGWYENPWIENPVTKILDVDLAVYLFSITEAEFYYLSALNILDSDVLDEYISDPIRIPSNVHGGAGFVGINGGYGQVIHIIEGKKIKVDNYWR